MNEILVRTNKGEYNPGDDVCGAVYLRIISPTAGRGVQVKFTGYERFSYELRKDAKNTVCYKQHKDYVDYQDVKLFESEAPLSIGNRLIPFRIHLPTDMPGTFAACHLDGDVQWEARVEYLLQVNLIGAAQLKAAQPITLLQPLPVGTMSFTQAVVTSFPVRFLIVFKRHLHITSRLKQHVYRTGESLQLRIIITNDTRIAVVALRIRLIRKIVFMCKQSSVSPVPDKGKGTEDPRVSKDDERIFICAEDGCVVREQEVDMSPFPRGMDNFHIPLRNSDNSCIYPTVRGMHVHCDYVIEILARLSSGQSFDVRVPVSVVHAQNNEEWRTWVEPDWVACGDVDTVCNRSVFSVPDNLLRSEMFSSLPGLRPL